MNFSKSLAVASLALLLLAACGSSGIGDILGGGNTSTDRYEIRGVVDSIDTSSHSIYLTNVSGYTSMLSNGGGSNVRVYYDNDTRVAYNGSTYRPEDLERGDEVSVRVDESGNSLVAEDVTVLRDVTSGSSSYPSDAMTTIRGTVRYVDTSRRTIEVDRGYGTTVFVEYDTATPVYFGNQTYRPADLERGDEIEIRTRDLGSGRFAAQDITVTRNVSGGSLPGSSSSASMSTIRGTVRSIDFDRRLIDLESASFISGFNSGAGTGTNVVTVHFDANAQIDVSGRMQSVSGLERGDVIEVRVTNSGGQYWADRLYLVQDVRR